MTGVTAAQAGTDPQLGIAIQAAEERRRFWWRLAFVITWLVILFALVAFVAATVRLDTTFLQKSVPYILAGVTTTLFVSFASIVLAIALAMLGALGRLSRNPVFNAIASFYVSFFRGTPLLLQILFLYLGLPQAGIVLPALPTGIIALGFNYGAYMTEIFRAGIQAVPHGQTEAAQSLGMTGRTTFRRIVIPQAFRIVTPAIGNDFIAMLKDSSLVSVIGVQEILWRAQTIGRPSFQSMQTILVAAMVYWAMTILLSVLQNRLERRMAVGDRSRSG